MPGGRTYVGHSVMSDAIVDTLNTPLAGQREECTVVYVAETLCCRPRMKKRNSQVVVRSPAHEVVDFGARAYKHTLASAKAPFQILSSR